MTKLSGPVLPSHRLHARDLVWRAIGPAAMPTKATEELVTAIAGWLAQGAAVVLRQTPAGLRLQVLIRVTP